ncbi:hypothetical protein ABU162_09340 [Paenibacillus thiaminolyticus]|uniref:hypothetical protein n=1 Tax=Paenibacillus thiaminolyticus TaxID=49283 RepID=UPI0035A63009
MDDFSLNTIGSLIGSIGFPSLIAIILLRTVLDDFNRRLDKLDRQLIQLNKSILMVAKRLDQLAAPAVDYQVDKNTEVEKN